MFRVMFIMSLLCSSLALAAEVAGGFKLPELTGPIDIILLVGLVFAIVKAISDLLNYISKLTASSADDKAAGIFSKIVGFVGSILDYLTANSRPKDPK